VINSIYFDILENAMLHMYMNSVSLGCRIFSLQQYFDEKGMFISLLFSTPLLINCFILVVSADLT